MSWQASSIFIVLSFGFLTAPLALTASLIREMPLNEILLKYSIPILASITFSLSLLIAGVFLLYTLRVANLELYLAINRIRKYLDIDQQTVDEGKIIPSRRKYKVEQIEKSAYNRLSLWGILIHLYLTLIYVVCLSALFLYGQSIFPSFIQSSNAILSVLIWLVALILSIFGWLVVLIFMWRVIAGKMYRKLESRKRKASVSYGT